LPFTTTTACEATVATGGLVSCVVKGFPGRTAALTAASAAAALPPPPPLPPPLPRLVPSPLPPPPPPLLPSTESV
jgi:hypothetical protein